MMTVGKTQMGVLRERVVEPDKTWNFIVKKL